MDYDLKLQNKEMFEYFKDLIALRKNNKALALTTRSAINEKVTVTASNGNIVMTIKADGGDICVVHTCNAGTINLDKSYTLLFTNNDEMTVGQAYTEVSAKANMSLVFKA